jgi:hypothetical protein
MAVPRSRVRGFLWQLSAGKSNQKALDTVMGEMAHVKLDLGVHIQLVNVGLIRGVEQRVLVSVATVEAVNRQLQEKLGSSHQLRISRVIEGRPRNSEFHVVYLKRQVFLTELDPYRDLQATEQCHLRTMTSPY